MQEAGGRLVIRYPSIFHIKKILRLVAGILNLQMVTRKDGLVPPALE